MICRHLLKKLYMIPKHDGAARMTNHPVEIPRYASTLIYPVPTSSFDILSSLSFTFCRVKRRDATGSMDDVLHSPNNDWRIVFVGYR